MPRWNEGCSINNMQGTGSDLSKPDFRTVFEAAPELCLVLLPDAPRYTIVAVSDAYARATMTTRDEILGRGFFDVLPDNPADPTGGGVTKLSASLEHVLTERVPDAVEMYAILGPAESGRKDDRRWWSSMSSPVLGSRGDLAYIIHTVEDVTEKHQLEEERQHFAALLDLANQLFDQASDSILIADMHGQLTEVNASACRMLGYAREELIGKNIRDILSPEDVPRLAAAREYLLSAGMVQVAEWTNLRKDGTPVPVEASAKILPDGRWQAIVRDISERKRIERTLQESEERFRLTIDEAPIGMALVALDGRFVRVNRALCEIVGYPSDELTRLSFQAITHPDDVARDRAALGQLIRGEMSRYQREKRYISKDGRIVEIMLSVSVLRDRDGTPLNFISQMEDISERKRAEAALKESERRLNLALDSAQIGMWDLDLATDTSVRSLRHDQIFGYSSPLPTWGTAIFLTHVVPEDREAAQRAFETAFMSGKFDMECRIIRPDSPLVGSRPRVASIGTTRATR